VSRILIKREIHRDHRRADRQRHFHRVPLRHKPFLHDQDQLGGRARQRGGIGTGLRRQRLERLGVLCTQHPQEILLDIRVAGNQLPGLAVGERRVGLILILFEQKAGQVPRQTVLIRAARHLDHWRHRLHTAFDHADAV